MLPLLPLVTLDTPFYRCYLVVPLVTLVILVSLCYPLFPFLPFVTLVISCYLLLPLVTLVTFCCPCFPLLLLVTLVTICYLVLPLLSVVTLVTICYPFYPLLPLLPLVLVAPLVTPGYPLSENIEDTDTCFDGFVSQSSSGNFSFQQISPALVSSLLLKLCTRKATGLDIVSARLLRECFDLICDCLALIFNRSIETSIFPDEWKSARITPLYKKFGNRRDPSNYSPISIIPVVAKVFEQIVYDQLYRYLTENKLLCCYQSAFRILHSTVTALIEATDRWS